jgi:hypothetical protein
MFAMIDRRIFVAGCAASAAFTGAGLWAGKAFTSRLEKKLKAGFENNKCTAECFSEDWSRYGYEKYYYSLFEIARTGGLTPIAAGQEIRTEIQEAFGGAHLHDARPESLRILAVDEAADFSLRKVEFTLDCGLPVRGCFAVPHDAPRGLAILAHGMGTTPERCFNLQFPDYMRSIGSRLCAAGFAVWCPFMPQAGNQTSQDSLAGMLSFAGISYHNAFCSTLNLGRWVSRQFSRRDLHVVRFGMSWGSVMSANLEAATGERIPTVLSGYLRNEVTLMESSWLQSHVDLPFMTYLHELPGAAKYFLPQLARQMRPCRLYFEIGDKDGLSNNRFGRDETFANIQAIYREVDAADAVTLELFEGEHEVAGTKAIAWLTSQV